MDAFSAVKRFGDLLPESVVRFWNDFRDHRSESDFLTENGGHKLDGNSYVLNDLLQHLIGLLRFLQRGGVEAIHDYSVGEYWNDQRLDVFWGAVAAALEEGHGLCCAVESLRSARGDSE